MARGTRRARKWEVRMSKAERALVRRVQRRTACDGIRCRCAVLLAADEARGRKRRANAEVANMSGVCEATVTATCRDFCEGGVARALSYARARGSDTARLRATGDVEAFVVATACSPAPKGRCRWTLTLLAGATAAILEVPLSRSTVGRVLARNELRPHLCEYWCIPPGEDAGFVAAMEDVLDVYARPYDPARPVWCMDEKPYQLLGEAREPLPMRPGDVAKVDSEYARDGTACVFCFCQPLTGDILQSVEPTRTAVDWAERVRWLVDEVEPDADVVVLVMDNLNTHRIASLYKAFPPEEARRVARRLEIHYTPPHGSWLDAAEIAINVMTRQCLDRRMPSIEALRSELDAWQEAHNADPAPIDWQFTASDGRVRLRRLYPDFEACRAERDGRRARKLAG